MLRRWIADLRERRRRRKLRRMLWLGRQARHRCMLALECRMILIVGRWGIAVLGDRDQRYCVFNRRWYGWSLVADYQWSWLAYDHVRQVAGKELAHDAG